MVIDSNLNDFWVIVFLWCCNNFFGVFKYFFMVIYESVVLVIILELLVCYWFEYLREIYVYLYEYRSVYKFILFNNIGIIES